MRTVEIDFLNHTDSRVELLAQEPVCGKLSQCARLSPGS